jgi:hypothetical protein
VWADLESRKCQEAVRFILCQENLNDAGHRSKVWQEHCTKLVLRLRLLTTSTVLT